MINYDIVPWNRITANSYFKEKHIERASHSAILLWTGAQLGLLHHLDALLMVSS